MTRSLLTASVLFLGMNAFAAGTTAPATTTAPAAAPAAAAAPAPEQGKKVASSGNYAKAKEECLKENSSLKGKALRQCIKGKEGK